MPKKNKKRTAEEYEKEIADAAKRMKKRPEHLRAASDSEAWKDFLDDIGVTTGHAPFWDSVREKVMQEHTPYTPRRLAEANVKITTGVYRDAKGHFTKEADGNKPVISYRDNETGRFVSRKTIDKR